MRLFSRTRILLFILPLLILGPSLKRGGTPLSSAAVSPKLYDPDPGWVKKTMKRMSLRDKVAQLIQIRVPGRFLNRRSPRFLQIADEIRRNHIGGVVLFAGDVYESARLLNDLQEMSEVPLFVTADFESGASFRISDTTSFPWSMAVGATGSVDYAYMEGAVTAREARALGVQWILAPVLDVNNNPDNPVINIRSYGEDPDLVARLGAAFIRGARDNGVLTTAKHFPGHGDTATDSHIGLPVVPSDLSRLNSVELVPFRRAIEAGVDSIMTAHVAVPRVTGEPDLPATLSPKILTGLLRDSLHFQGLVLTDAMEMGGITSRYWCGLAAVRALEAGADVLLLPPDTGVALNEVVRAVRRGDLSEERIDESVRKVLSLKTRVRLQKERTVDLDRIEETISAPESERVAQDIADHSITLIRDDAHLLPIDPINPPKIFSLVMSSDLDTSPASAFQAEVRKRYPSARTESLDPRTPEDLVKKIEREARAADIVICATLVRVITGRDSSALPGKQRSLLESLVGMRKPVVWVAFGNPYVLRLQPRIKTYLCTYSYTQTSQIAAARALSGEIAITGHSPVSIPGYSKIGDGIRVPRLDTTLKAAPLENDGAEDPFADTKRALEEYVRKGAFPGASLAVGCDGSLVLDTAAGRLDYSPDSAEATPETIYDLASLSKVVGTTSAATMLYESRALLLDAPVEDYLSEFRGPGKEKVRIRHLLLHSSGLPAWLPLYRDTRGYDEFLKRICDVPLEFAPGERTQYSDLGMILLGEIISRAAGEPLDGFLARRLFEPLGMDSTFYRPPKKLLERIAPTEKDPWRGRVVRGEVHDENAAAMGGVAGHAGLFSTTHDLARFAQMMLNRGLYDHRRYWRGRTVDLFTGESGAPGAGQALGWRKPSAADWTGRVFSPSAYGHTGFTGTMMWIDPGRRAFIILLTNRVHPTRENQGIVEAREKLAESIMKVLDSGRH